MQAQRPENTVMQALESLNDAQVNDFLTGKTPLNLSMRLGDHMMLIQLQLSTVNPSALTSSQSNSGPRTRGLIRSRTSATKQQLSTNVDSGASIATSSQSTTTISSASSSTPTKPSGSTSNYTSPDGTPNKYQTSGIQTIGQRTATNGHQLTMNVPPPSTTLTSQHQIPIRTVNQSDGGHRDLILSSEEFENLRSIVSSLTNMRNSTTTNDDDGSENEVDTSFDSTDALLEQSPIKSLSNLVSSPIKTIPLKSIPNASITSSSSLSTPTASTLAMVAGASTINVIKSHSVDNHRNAINSNITCSDPITAKLTSCLCKRLNTNCNSNGCDTSCQLQRQPRDTKSTTQLQSEQCSKHYSSGSPSNSLATATLPQSSSSSTSNENRSMRASSLLHRTLHNPIGRIKSSHTPQSNSHHRQINNTSSSSSNVHLRRSKSSDNLHFGGTNGTRSSAAAAASTIITNTSATQITKAANSVNNITDITATKLNGPNGIRTAGTLAEASRNLTKTLRKLSKEVFTNKVDVAALAGEDSSRSRNSTNTAGQLTNSENKNSNNNTNGNTTVIAGGSTSAGSSSSSGGAVGSGAVIESMRSHGKGIYSGTFSGTLNPALQDRYGRPKRDISTVIHILNDLLSATPHYSRGARISFEPTGTTRSFKHVSIDMIINKPNRCLLLKLIVFNFISFIYRAHRDVYRITPIRFATIVQNVYRQSKHQLAHMVNAMVILLKVQKLR